MEAAEREVRAVHAAWIEAVNACDLACLLRLMADDVVFLGPGQVPFGREAFAAPFLAAHQQSVILCRSELEEVVLAGDVAYTRCHDTLTVETRAGGATAALAGYRLTVYCKQPDGRWQLARDAHTLLPVAP